MTRILALLSGADGRLLNYAEAGRTAWMTVGLNILLAGILSGAAAALGIEMLLPYEPYLLWVWAGILALCLTLITLRLIIKHTIPNLSHPLVASIVISCLFGAAFVISMPFEIKLLSIANPGGALVNAGSIQDQLLEWVKATNGVHTLMMLRIAIRLSSLIILSLPFFVGWNARNGTYFQVKNAQKDLYKIFTSIK